MSSLLNKMFFPRNIFLYWLWSPSSLVRVIHMNFLRFSAILGFIIIGIMSRLIPHPPNFTSINAIALVSALFFGSRWLSFATVTLTVFLSDLIIGFHSTMPFVYLSFGLISLMGYKIREGVNLQRIPIVCLATSLIFFVISNFGEWAIGSLYPKTLSGFLLCYTSAVPFFFNQVLGDLIYGNLLFTLCSFLRALIKTPCSEKSFEIFWKRRTSPWFFSFFKLRGFYVLRSFGQGRWNFGFAR